MGTVGLASYQFGSSHYSFPPTGAVPGGLVLPLAGGVETTASIGKATGRGLPVEVMQLPEESDQSTDPSLSQSQIDVLQREIVGLRRRLGALSEQNLAYSRRISALENEVALGKLTSAERQISAGEASAEPGRGVVTTMSAAEQTNPESIKSETAQELNFVTGTPAAKPKSQEQSAVFALPQTVAVPSASPETQVSPPRLISLYRDTAVPPASPDNDPGDPVRIASLSPREQPKPNLQDPPPPQVMMPQVTLPEAGPAPEATGSIPARANETLPDNFDPTPTQTIVSPSVITPSSPAGRLRGGGDIQLKRSDFGAIIGHYASTAAAAKAWSDFKNQNVERMRDLRPLLMQRNSTEGGVALMVGPFANAADAAMACLQLLDVTELCHPALYAGDPLVTAAEFRDTAF